MPKTRTVRNPAHPWNQYKDQRNEARKQLQQMSNAQVEQNHRHRFPEASEKLTRKAMTDALLGIFDQEWRMQWEDKYGWPFEEVRDFDKLKARIDAGEFNPEGASDG